MCCQRAPLLFSLFVCMQPPRSYILLQIRVWQVLLHNQIAVEYPSRQLKVVGSKTAFRCRLLKDSALQVLPEDVLAIVLRHAVHMQVLQFGPDVYEDLPDLAPQPQLEYVNERVSTALTMVKHSYKLFVKMLYGSTIAVWALPTDNGFDLKNRVCLQTAHSTFKIARSDGVFLEDRRSLQEQGITAGTTLREIGIVADVTNFRWIIIDQ